MFKKIFFLAIYIIFLPTLAELSSRTYFYLLGRQKHGISFTNPDLSSMYYPIIDGIKKRDIRKDDKYFDVLMLGGSVLNYQCISNVLPKKLGDAMKKEVRVFNASNFAHTSADSLYKYKLLSDKEFDLVMFYHAINETRVNNCPPDIFKIDYSCYGWYEEVSEIDSLRNINKYFIFPYFFNFIWIKGRQKYFQNLYISTSNIGATKKEYLDYGKDIKTKESIRRNITAILEIAKKKREKVLLMSFATYVPDGYSIEKFLDKSLDYTFLKKPITIYASFPVELWGKVDNVKKGVRVHNEVIKSLAEKYDNAVYLDQDKLIPKDGKYFFDICHFSLEGHKKFADNISSISKKLDHF